MKLRTAIVVFGCAVTPLGEPSPALERRLRHALEVWQRQTENLLVVSGGRLRGLPAEAGVMQRWLMAHGVPASHIVLESESLHTFHNADYVAPLLAELGVDHVILVTDAFHMGRSRRLLRDALTHHGVRAALATEPAPDDLDLLARGRRWVRERLALWRDLRRRPSGPAGR
ncbi:MAG TPA: YdcF family protein [Myxococcota bacterium]|nr:YdcF family protein [Myxococcota bacterium]